MGGITKILEIWMDYICPDTGSEHNTSRFHDVDDRYFISADRIPSQNFGDKNSLYDVTLKKNIK